MPRATKVKTKKKKKKLWSVRKGQIFRDLDGRNTILRRLYVTSLSQTTAWCKVLVGPNAKVRNAKRVVVVKQKRLQTPSLYTLCK